MSRPVEIKDPIRKQRAEAVKIVCDEEWSARPGGKLEKTGRDGLKLVVAKAPEHILDADGEAVGVDAWVQLFDDGGRELKIDPHRRIINPPTVPRSGIRIIGRDEHGFPIKERTPDPLAAFWEAVWDSIGGAPNPKGWRTRGTVTTIFATAPGGSSQVRGADAVYSTARAGSGTLQSLAGGTVGQSNSLSTYFCWESFFEFDTSSIPDADQVTSVLMELFLDNDNSGVDFIIEVREHDYGGGSVTNGDWVSSSAGTQVATINSSGIGATGSYKSFTSDAAFLTTANMKTGTCRFIFISREQTNNSAPGVDTSEQLGFEDADNAGTTEDPKITITHGAGTLPPIYSRPNRIWRIG